MRQQPHRESRQLVYQWQRTTCSNYSSRYQYIRKSQVGKRGSGYVLLITPAGEKVAGRDDLEPQRRVRSAGNTINWASESISFSSLESNERPSLNLMVRPFMMELAGREAKSSIILNGFRWRGEECLRFLLGVSCALITLKQHAWFKWDYLWPKVKSRGPPEFHVSTNSSVIGHAPSWAQRALCSDALIWWSIRGRSLSTTIPWILKLLSPGL